MNTSSHTYSQVMSAKSGAFEKIIFKNDVTGEFSICFYSDVTFKYSRPTSNGLTVSSQSESYVLIGAPTCKTLKTAKKWLAA